MYCTSRTQLLKNNGGLDSRLVLDALESLAKVLQLKRLVDDTLGLDLARVEVVNCGGCGVQIVRFIRLIRIKVRVDLRNMYVSENEPMMVISSPKILEGGHETLSLLA